MEIKIKKKLKIEKSLNPDETGTHILFLHNITKHGENWRRIFKGKHKDCLILKRELEGKV